MIELKIIQIICLKFTFGNVANNGPRAKITTSTMIVLIRATIWVLTPIPSPIKHRDIPTHPGNPLKKELATFPMPYAKSSWFGEILYLYFLAKSWLNDTFKPKVRIAIELESPSNLENKFIGGTVGAGNLYLFNIWNSKIYWKRELKFW